MDELSQQIENNEKIQDVTPNKLPDIGFTSKEVLTGIDRQWALTSSNDKVEYKVKKYLIFVEKIPNLENFHLLICEYTHETDRKNYKATKEGKEIEIYPQFIIVLDNGKETERKIFDFEENDINTILRRIENDNY